MSRAETPALSACSEYKPFAFLVASQDVVRVLMPASTLLDMCMPAALQIVPTFARHVDGNLSYKLRKQNQMSNLVCYIQTDVCLLLRRQSQ
jgi:hypothetical protein